MGAGAQIPFLVDENLPVDQMRSILEGRGHLVTPAEIGSSDSTILARAEETSSIVVTADTWFLDELFRYPVGHRRCFRYAGVIQVPGVWTTTRLRITNYLPIIEALYAIRGDQPDRRLAIDLSRRWIRIWEP